MIEPKDIVDSVKSVIQKDGIYIELNDVNRVIKEEKRKVVINMIDKFKDWINQCEDEDDFSMLMDFLEDYQNKNLK